MSCLCYPFRDKALMVCHVFFSIANVIYNLVLKLVLKSTIDGGVLLTSFSEPRY
jgi:hypothetical protein